MEERYITSKIEPPEAEKIGVITLQDGEFHTGFALWHKRNDRQIPKFSSALPGQGFPPTPQPPAIPSLSTPQTPPIQLSTPRSPDPPPHPPTILPTPYFELIYPEGGIS